MTHTYFRINHFVVNKLATLPSKANQCILVNAELSYVVIHWDGTFSSSVGGTMTVLLFGLATFDQGVR